MESLRAQPPAVESLDHEVKFVLPAHSAGPVRALLAGLFRPEVPHARSRIGTIYFDDRSLSSAEEKLASDYRKTKIRLRWYDGAGPVQLEVKRRVGSRREKLRREISADGTRLETGGLSAAARCGVAEALCASGIVPPADLAPALRLTYERERYFDAATGARLSLDTAIVAIEQAPWCAAADLERGAPRELAVALVECKGASRELPPALRVLEMLGARRRSFSKYTACLLHGFR